MTVRLSTRGYLGARGRAVRYARRVPGTISAIRIADVVSVVLRPPRIPTPAPPPAAPVARPTITVMEVPIPTVTIQSITIPTMAPPIEPEPTPTAGSGWIRIVDIAAQDASVVYDKVWQDPGETIVQSATATTPEVVVVVEASYPLILVNDAPATLAKTNGYYAGNLNVTVGPTGGTIQVKVVTGDDEEGAVDTTEVTVAAPPEIVTLSFSGSYPAGQTELKAGDTFQITGTTTVPVDAVEILDFGAFDASLQGFATSTVFTVAGTVANRGTTLQLLAARVRARNPGGAYGPTRDTNANGGTVNGVDVVALNNTYPTVSFGTPTYPPGQGGLKGAESAVFPVTLTDASSVLFDSPTGEVTITNPTTIEPTKTVQRVSGAYNVATPNLRANATRGANGALTVGVTTVAIANVAATITVTEPAARLRSGGNDGTVAQTHSITVTASQQLLGTPTLSPAPTAGVFVGGWTGGPTVFQRDLQVHDNDPKGTFAWQGLVATNLAGIVTTGFTGDASYTLGGFVPRAVTFAPFATTAEVNAEVVDFAKLTAGVFTATNQPGVKQPIGTPAPVTNGYTIDATGLTPTGIVWLDTTAAGTNATGTAQLTAIEESV